MNDDFIVLCPSKERDPDGSKLEEALSAHLSLERARSFRNLVVYLQAVLGGAAWVSTALPAAVSPGFRSFALSAWVVCLLGLAMAAASEFRWYRRRAALMATVRTSPEGGASSQRSAG